MLPVKISDIAEWMFAFSWISVSEIVPRLLKAPFRGWRVQCLLKFEFEILFTVVVYFLTDSQTSILFVSKLISKPPQEN